MQDIWKPNNPGDDITGVNNYKIGYSWPQKYWNFSERVDWNISDNWKVFFRYSRVKTTLDQTEYVQLAGDDQRQRRRHEQPQHRGRHGIHAQPDHGAELRMSFASLEDDYIAPKSADRRERAWRSSGPTTRGTSPTSAKCRLVITRT